MSACDDFRASFGEDPPICWLCQALKERDEALEKARWSDHIAECRGKEIISREEEIEELQHKLEQMKGNAWPAMCLTLQSMRDEARKERDEAREELGWKRLCPKCEEHYSDPNDLGECPVCETQTRNNRLSEMLQEIWDAAEQETGDWRDVSNYFTKLRKERDEVLETLKKVTWERCQFRDQRDEALAGIEAMRHLNDKDREAWLYSVQHHHDEMCRYKSERDEARVELEDAEVSVRRWIGVVEQGTNERDEARALVREAVAMLRACGPIGSYTTSGIGFGDKQVDWIAKVIFQPWFKEVKR